MATFVFFVLAFLGFGASNISLSSSNVLPAVSTKTTSPSATSDSKQSVEFKLTEVDDDKLNADPADIDQV